MDRTRGSVGLRSGAESRPHSESNCPSVEYAACLTAHPTVDTTAWRKGEQYSTWLATVLTVRETAERIELWRAIAHEASRGESIICVLAAPLRSPSFSANPHRVRRVRIRMFGAEKEPSRRSPIAAGTAARARCSSGNSWRAPTLSVSAQEGPPRQDVAARADSIVCPSADGTSMRMPVKNRSAGRVRARRRQPCGPGGPRSVKAVGAIMICTVEWRCGAAGGRTVESGGASMRSAGAPPLLLRQSPPLARGGTGWLHGKPHRD